MKKMKMGFVVILVTSLIPFFAASAEDLPEWVTEWQDFARSSGNREMVEFVERLSDPKALELGKNWAAYQGFDAPSYVKANDPAPEIKPGLEITSENYQDYPGLKKLMPPEFYEMLAPGAFAGFGKMTIVPTFHYYPPPGRQKYTKQYEGQCTIADEFNLENWTAGYPFPKVDLTDPMVAPKLMHNLDVGATGNDDWEDDPLTFFLFGRDNELERTHVCRLIWKFYQGRTENEPIHGKDVNYREKGVMIVKSPYDIAGFIGLKTRFTAPEKIDDFVTYVPSMRRIRRLSGSNTQDPLIGSDFSWDDWRGFWIKLSNKVYDIRAEYIGEEIQLLPTKTFPIQWKGSKVDLYWEKRPFYVVDLFVGGNYTYARQRIWIDKELFHLGYKTIFDQKGRLWKKYYPVHFWRPEKGTYDWYSNIMIDMLNKHWSGMNFGPVDHDEALPDSLFNLGSLLRRAK